MIVQTMMITAHIMEIHFFRIFSLRSMYRQAAGARSGACLKNHSRNLHAPLCRIFHPNSVAVARYGALIRAKYPTNCDAHLAESLFQTHSNVTSIPHIFITHSYYRIKLILTTVSQDNLSISKRRKVILICIINLCYINVNPV